jgi:hypothetical protein
MSPKKNETHLLLLRLAAALVQGRWLLRTGEQDKKEKKDRLTENYSEPVTHRVLREGLREKQRRQAVLYGEFTELLQLAWHGKPLRICFQ